MPSDDTIIPAPRSTYFTQHVERLGLKKPGRPIGAQSQRTINLRQSLLRVYEELGGEAGLLAFALDQPEVFYGKILPRVLPLEATKEEDGRVTIIVSAPAPSPPRPPEVRNPHYITHQRPSVGQKYELKTSYCFEGEADDEDGEDTERPGVHPQNETKAAP